MRHELDALIEEALRAEAPAAGDKAAARELLARRIARGDHVALESERPDAVPADGVRAPGVARAGWVLLSAAAVAAALLVGRSSSSSKEPLVEVPAAAPAEPSPRVRAPDTALSPLPELPALPAPLPLASPSRVTRRHSPPVSAEPPRAAPSPPVAREPEAVDTAAGNLAAESRALGEVQRALRDGEPRRALQLLDEHDRRFARGVLLEERAAARAIASCGAGLGDAARESARAFAARYQNSPLRARVRASCKDFDRELSGPLP